MPSFGKSDPPQNPGRFTALSDNGCHDSGFSQALAQEVAEFGIRVTLVEPGTFATDWAGPSAQHAKKIGAYDGARERRQTQRSTFAAGDPAASARALMQLVDAEDPPLRVFFGPAPLNIAKADYASRIETWDRWNDLSVQADG